MSSTQPLHPTAQVSEPDPLLGRVLGNYVIKRRLTEGGMGHVYIAEHEKLGHRAAVKVLKREMATDDEWSRRFLTEAQAGARLQSSNLVRVIDFGKMEDGYDYLMMEFLDGVPLNEYAATLRAQDSLDALAVLTFAEQILNGLGAAHAERVFHRDLKPANVMVLQEHTGKPLLKLIDFGLAKAGPLVMAGGVGPRDSQASLMAGTPEYISPEQACGKVVDGRADLYSLGVMLYELLSGKLPFDGTVEETIRAHVSNPPPFFTDAVSAALPEGLEDFVWSLLEKDPERRPPSAEAAKKTVQRILRKVRPEETQVKRNPLLAGAPEAAPAAGAVAAPSTKLVLPIRMRSNRGRAAAIAAVLLLLVLVGFGLLWRPAPTPTRVAELERPKPPAAEQARPPAPPAPAPVRAQEAEAAAPVVPKVDPQEVDLAPLPKQRPRAEARRVVVSEKDCVVDGRWAKDRQRDLDELSKLAANTQTVGALEMENAERTIGAAISKAQSSSDCVQVTTELESLRARVLKP